MYDSHRSFVQRKITFSRRASPNYALSKRRASPAHMSGARGWGVSRHSSFIETTKANKNQQLRVGRDWFRHNKHQQKSTKINRVSKSQQKSAKVSKSQQKSAKVSKSQQNHRRSPGQSAKVSTFCSVL